MSTLRTFRLLAVRLALIVTAVLAGVLWPFSPIAAKGLLGGGIAGVLAFWVLALRFEKVAPGQGVHVQYTPLRWAVLRLALFAIVLFWAYTLDRETFHGFGGAAAGLFVMQVVMALLGLTGWDLKKEGDSDGAHR